MSSKKENQIKVLIVDDDFTIRESIKKLLTQAFNDISIITSDNGIKGLGLIELYNPDLLVVDSTLPEFAGAELVQSIKDKEGFGKKRRIILIHEDENLPQLNDPAIVILNKNDNNFVDNFISYLSYTFSVEVIPTYRTSIQNKIIKKVLKVSNHCDVLMHKIQKRSNFILNSISWIKWLFNQIYLSFLLTFLYIFGGGKVKEANPQSSKDLTFYRVRYYPTITTLIVGLILFLFQLGVFVASGFAVLNYNIRQLVAQTSCPLPSSPSVINNQVTLTPDNIDGIIDCASLDIIVGPTGEIIIDRYVTENSSTDGDWGVTLLVNNLTVQNGGKITADGNGYQVIETESIGQGGNSAGQTGGAGGGHGGAGGQGIEDVSNPSGFGGSVYGSIESPHTLGGAGGSGAGTSDLYSKTWDSKDEFTANGTVLTGTKANDNDQIVLTDNTTGSNVNNGLVAYYKFDEASYSNTPGQVIDSSLSAKNATPGNDINTTEAGKFGRALSVNGTNNYVTVPDIHQVGINDTVSISTWVYANSTSNYDMIARHENGEYVFYAFGSGGVAFDILESERTASGLPTNEWVHLVAVYENNAMKVYLNGELLINDFRSTTGGLPNSESDLTIGNTGYNGYIWGFNGLIDDFRLYNRDLSQAEVQQIYNYIPPTEYTSGEQSWTSETIDATSLGSLNLSSIVADWELDGTDNINPKFQIEASLTGEFTGEQTTFPAVDNYYQSGGEYPIQDSMPLDLSASITSYYTYYRIKAYIDTGIDVTDTPKINSIQVSGTSLQAGSSFGGAGGGAIRITATGSVVVNGKISANGLDGQASGATSGGGGAGGSVWIEADSLSGSGLIEARGGSAADVQYQGGGGGGGRVVVLCTASNTFNGTASVAPGITGSSQDGGIGTIIGPTCRPNAPTVLKQFKSNQTNEIFVNGITTETTVVFASNLIDVDASDTLSLQIEFRELGQDFTGVPTHTQSSNIANPQSCNTPVADCGKITVSSITRSKEYHWRARVRDNKGGYSYWVSYGNNLETDRDVLVTGTPANIQYISGNNQTGIVNTQIVDPLVIRVVDSVGFPVPGYTVNWSISNGGVGGRFSGGNAITDDDGYSSRYYTLGTKSINNQVRAIGSGLVDSPITFDFVSTPDLVASFGVSTSSYSLINEAFTVNITAYDQYSNIKTDYIGNPSLSAVNPDNINTVVSGVLDPTSYQFQSGDLGVKSITLTFDTQASVRIKVTDGSAIGTSNIIAIVTSLGSCPDVDGIIDTNQTWAADTNNHGIFDCTNVSEVRIKSGSTLVLASYIVSDSNYDNEISVVVLAQNIVVEPTGIINADSRGYTGNTGPGAAVGGGYGGFNGSDTPYGSVKEPISLGSGGNWGAGAGALKLDVIGTITNNGIISANGGDTGDYRYGGGAGGSIFIVTDVLDGNGLIRTNGGTNGYASGGYSTGGRIAIYRHSGSYPINNKANIQSFGRSPGTIYIDEDGNLGGNGDLYANNNGSNGYAAGVPYDANNPTQQFNKIYLKEYGHLKIYGINSTLVISSETGIEGDNSTPSLSPEGSIQLPTTFTVDRVNLDVIGNIQGANNLTIGDGTNPARVTLYARNQKRQNDLYPNQDKYTFTTLNVKNTSYLYLQSYVGNAGVITDNNAANLNDYGVDLTSENITVDSGGFINADSRGYSANVGPGAAAGGGYGGFNGSDTPYGSVKEPVSLGSGGNWGAGAGAIKLTATNTLTNNGTISSKGGDTGDYRNGGGSGGSILVVANTLNGAGLMQVNSGVNGYASGGYSTGGRIAIYKKDGTYPLNSKTNLQSFGYAPGTIYIDEDGDLGGNGDLYINNNGSNGYYAGIPYDVLNPIQEFNTIYLKEYGHLRAYGIDSTLVIANEAGVIGDTTVPSIATEGLLQLPAVFTVDRVNLDIIGNYSGAETLTVGNGTDPAKLTFYARTQRRQNELYPNQDQYNFDTLTLKNNTNLYLQSYVGSGSTTADNNVDNLNEYGVSINATTLSVENGGVINAEGRGYSPNAGPGAGGANGGGYGGYNGSNTPYGSVKEPVSLGSGGNYGTSYGGGAIKLNVSGVLTNNGIISSLSGGSGDYRNSGGAGGSVWIISDTFNGSGVVKASAYTPTGRIGTGGRIAIYRHNGDYPINTKVNLQAFGYSPGTIYIDEDGDLGGNGDLYINNNGSNGYYAGIPYDSNAPTQQFNKVYLKEYGHLRAYGISSTLVVSSETGIEGDNTTPGISTEGLLQLPSTFTIDRINLDIIGGIQGASDLTIGDGTNPARLTLYARTQKRQDDLYPNQSLYSFDNFTVKNSAIVYLRSYVGNGGVTTDNNSANLNDYGVELNAINITIDNGGNINADSFGYSAGAGPGAAAGGGYGGFNGSDTPYGSVKEPIDLGSGGNWGAGAGSIKLTTSGTLTNNGTISAKGGDTGDYRNGGGSGGSIFIVTDTFNGSGLIRANSGADGYASGGYSSGGRIAVYKKSGTYPINSKVNIQSFGYAPGTIFIDEDGDLGGSGDLYINNNGASGYYAGIPYDSNNPVQQFGKIYLKEYGNLRAYGIASTLQIDSETGIEGDNTTPSISSEGLIQLPTTFTVDRVNLDVIGSMQGANTLTIGDGTNPARVTLYALTQKRQTDLFPNQDIYNFDSLTIQNASILYLQSYVGSAATTADNNAQDKNDYGVTINSTNLNVISGGSINADGRGYGANAGPGGAGGGNYGGVYGGYSSDHVPYGDFREPSDLGSGGNYGSASGGGAVTLNIADTLSVGGTITTNGNPTGDYRNTGGSGGSVYINAATLNGSGLIRANGASKGGTGGRIAIYKNNGDFQTDNKNYIQAFGAASDNYAGRDAGPGTIYIENTGLNSPGQGSLYLENNGLAGRAMDFEAIDYNLDDVFIGSNVTAYLKQDLLALRSEETVAEGGNVENLGDAIAIWNFEEENDDSCSGAADYCDASGNNRSLNSFGSSRNANGKVGNALELNGSNYAEVDVSDLTVTSFTVGMWAKLSQFTANGSEAEELINFNNVATTSSLDIDGSRQLRFEWPSKLVTGLVSQGKTVTMANNNPSYPPANCVDGNTSNLCQGATVGANDWIQIDLGAVKNISKVNIWNRSDCCQDRFTDFKIEVSNTGSFSGEQSQVVNLTGQNVGFPSEYSFAPANARYLRVTKINNNLLNLAEIQVFESTTYLPDNQWQHVVASYDSTTGIRKIYVNGTEVNSLNLGTNYSLPLSKISIGKGGLGSSTGFVGLIDEVFLYPRALSSTEINIYERTYSWNEYNNKRGRGPVLNLTGNLLIDTNALLTGKALGFPSETGVGRGVRGAGQSGGAGGGHGGTGGTGESDGGNTAPQGGTFYGNQRTPFTLGSGGGQAGTGASGGAGGGAVALRVRSGDVTIRGTIDVSGENGKTASPGGGGGAGGSILIEGQTCSISGTLNAQGGSGGDDAFDGGGGGGGRISILYTQGPCESTGTVTVANGTSAGGQSGQVGTFPTISSIPSTPLFKDQYKIDGETAIPVGGVTPEQSVNLKASVSDPGADNLNPQSLVAEFEVVGLNESFTAAYTLKGKVVPDYKNTIFAGVYNSPTTEFSGGVPLVSEVNVSGLIPGEEYKWRARVLNEDTSVAGSWTEFGNNSSNQADFIVSNTTGLEITTNKTNVLVGETITLTVNAKDGSNNTDGTYRGTVQFTSNPSANSNLPSNYTFSGSDNGTATFNNQLSFSQAGTYTVTVTDTVAGSLTATTEQITVNLPPANANSITITPSKTTVKQGEQLSVSVSILDQYSDIFSSYNGTVTFGSTAGSNATIPSNYTYVGGDNGSHDFNNSVLFSQVGTYTITVTDIADSGLTATSVQITVEASIDSLSIVPSSTNVTAGDPISLIVSALTDTLQPDTYYRGTVTFTTTGNNNTILPSNYTFTELDDAEKLFTNGLVFTQAGTYTVTVTDTINNSITATSVPITVTEPAPTTATAIELESNKIEANVGEQLSLTVRAKDDLNAIVTNYNGTVTFTSSASPDATLPNNYQFTLSNSGVHEFSNELTFLKEGTFTVTVRDVIYSDLTDTITIQVTSSAKTLGITPSKYVVRIGEVIDLTVDAFNTQNNNDPLYRGSVNFTSTSASALLPSDYTFISGDSGRRVFTNSVKFAESGIYTIKVQDKNISNLNATSQNIIVNPENNCQDNPESVDCIADVQITNVTTENIGLTAQRICWETNISTIGNISYGLAAGSEYTNATPVEAEYAENHCQVIENLDESTQYIFNIHATSNAGKSDDYNDSFTTLNGEVIQVSDPRQCINNFENYSFNSNGQVVINYQTDSESFCKVHYGNASDSMIFSYEDKQKITNHTAILELANLDGVNDLYYKVDCVNTEKTCVQSGVIPISRYINYYPEKPFTIQVTEDTVPLILTITTIATGALNIITYPGMVMYAIPWIGKKRRKSTWGVIFDESTKEPIPFVLVRIYDEVGKIQKQIVTGFDGKYGFLVNKGTYTLEAKHSDYHFEKFEIEISENEGIAAKNIGLKKLSLKKNTIKEALLRFRESIKKNLPKINNSIVVIGFIISAIALVVTPSFFNYFVASIYLIQLLVLILLNARKREWGYVYDSANYKRIKSASVRVFDIKQGRQIDVLLTDAEGRFGFTLEPGSYHLQVNAAGYELDKAKLSKRYDRLESSIGQTLIKITVKKKEQITIEFPMKKSSEVLGKFEM